MKKNFTILLITIFSCFTANAQQERGIVGASNWLVGWTNIRPNKVDYPETTKILYSNITTNYRLSNTETYLLQGKVYITNNATLTIEPGTVIRGDSDNPGMLIITKGARIVAEGVQNSPIIFTSNKPIGERKAGDWGGVVLMGDAPINSIGGQANLDYDLEPQFRSYGGNNVQQDAGSMKYVRIEFAGNNPDRKKNFNGLTVAGIGAKTKLEYLQITNTNGNSFKFLGGNVNANNLVSYRTKNDDFNFTQGVQATLVNCAATRNAFVTSNDNARCINVKSFEKKELTDFTKKMSNVIADNFSLLNETDGEASAEGIIREAIYVNSDCIFALKNSIVSGFTSAFLFNSEIAITDANLKKITSQNVLINNCKANFQSELGGSTDGDLESHYSGLNFKNLYIQKTMGELFIAPKNDKTPDLRIKISDIH